MRKLEEMHDSESENYPPLKCELTGRLQRVEVNVLVHGVYVCMCREAGEWGYYEDLEDNQSAFP